MKYASQIIVNSFSNYSQLLHPPQNSTPREHVFSSRFYERMIKRGVRKNVLNFITSENHVIHTYQNILN